MENIRRYFKRTDKTYLLLCIFSSVMAVTALASLGRQAGQRVCRGRGHRPDHRSSATTAVRLVQAGAARIGLVIAVLLSNIDYRSLVKVWPVHVALTWGMVLPTLVLRNVSSRPADHRLQRRRYRQLLLVQAGRLYPPAHRAGQDQLYPDLCHAPEQCAQPDINEPKELGKLLLHLAGAHRSSSMCRATTAPPSSTASSAAA